MKKKVLIGITISFLILFLSSLVLFSNPVWEYKYENESEKYLHSNLYEISKDKLVGSLWIFDISSSENLLYITPFNNTERINRIEIDASKIGVLEDIEMKEIIDGSLAPIFLSIQIEIEKKNVFDKVSCLIKKGDYCSKDLSFSKIDIFNNKYPYPTLSEQESKELALFNIEAIEKSSSIISSEETICPELLSEYIYMSSNELDSEEILNKLKKIECTDILSLLSYIKIVEQSDSIYSHLKDELCEQIEPMDINNLNAVIRNSDIPILEEVCNLKEGLKAEEEEIKEDIFLTNQRILYILNKQGDSDFNEIKKDVINFLGVDVFTSWESPYCKNMYMCNMELINLSKVIFEIE